MKNLDLLRFPHAKKLIQVCKSDSGINGMQLRNAHYELGRMLAIHIAEEIKDENITVIIMMRAGLCFGMGVANNLEELGKKVSVLFYINDIHWKKEVSNGKRVMNNHILLIDSVINTGKGILRFAKKIENPNISFITNVLAEKALKNFDNSKLYAVRVSERSFVGSKVDSIQDNKGPDTGDRLFNIK